MAILPIVLYPNDILEKECIKVTAFDHSLEKLLDDMYETMVFADGVGLAAPQISIGKQITIVEVEENELIELINPVIEQKDGEEIDIEGCLSFPGLYGEVIRATSIKVTFQNRHGKKVILKAEGFLARAIQHEIDHLHGVLFTTKVLRYVELEEEG